jgi:hypothetical protein
MVDWECGPFVVRGAEWQLALQSDEDDDEALERRRQLARARAEQQRREEELEIEKRQVCRRSLSLCRHAEAVFFNCTVHCKCVVWCLVAAWARSVQCGSRIRGHGSLRLAFFAPLSLAQT